MKKEQISSGPNNTQTAFNVTVKSQSDIYELLFGINITLIGLLAMALALYRWNTKDLSLISFGVFLGCLLYVVVYRYFNMRKI